MTERHFDEPLWEKPRSALNVKDSDEAFSSNHASRMPAFGRSNAVYSDELRQTMRMSDESAECGKIPQLSIDEQLMLPRLESRLRRNRSLRPTVIVADFEQAKLVAKSECQIVSSSVHAVWQGGSGIALCMRKLNLSCCSTSW